MRSPSVRFAQIALAYSRLSAPLEEYRNGVR